ncbi:hypothetical protein FEM48_ZijujUnG0115600 [Ziziphus jujuba var. spinosa]|uniref:Amidase domain-containing protein n=1 Tax=Ziziphus jujuba var. spinosa TaxID=714518 RepID=A0A978U7Y8_ZIZJJ|nr:hypothetical protein FEM48_ZijujUnG0115600 [Ziziphus jujuba var. spinosa]
MHQKGIQGYSSASAAIVASGICPAALGTDGSVRIPSSLCGEVGLKAIFGCTDMEGLFCSGTLEIIGTIASTVEDSFNDVYSTDISEKCEDALNLLSKTHGCEQVGNDNQGLPIGMQLIGSPWPDASILRLASAVEVSTLFLSISLSFE